MNSKEEGRSVLISFQKDDLFSKFLEPNFNQVTFTSSILKSAPISDSLTKLNSGLTSLDKELNQQVSEHHEELLTQVNRIRELEEMLQVVTSGVDSLQNSLDRVTNEISQPTKLIQSKCKQLAHIQAACDLLRSIIRFLYLSKKLRTHVQNGPAELAKAAQCVLELELLRKESDLSGIQIIDAEIRWVIKAGEDIQNNASRMLSQGIETQNQAEVAGALQAFFHLGILESKINSIIKDLSEKVSQSITNLLLTIKDDPKSKENMKTFLWGRIEKLMDNLHSYCIQAWHLERVLSKMRNPSTNLSLLEDLIKPEEPTFMQSFWKSLCLHLQQGFERMAKGSTSIEAIFVSDFPKLYRFFQDFLKRLQTHYEMKQLTMSNDEQLIFMNILSQFKNVYLQKSFSRLYETVNRLFLGNSIPSFEEIQNIISIVTGELELSKLSSDEFALDVAKTMTRGIKLFAAKSETMIATDPSASQLLSEGSTPAQIRNAKIYANLYQLYSSIFTLSNTMPQLQTIFSDPLQQIQSIAEQILGNLFSKVTKLFEQSIYGIHSENFSKVDDQLTQISPFVKVLQTQISNFQNLVLSKFVPSPWLTSHIRNLCDRLLIYFVRHAALIRPLSENGKLKLVANIVQLEFSITSFQPTSLKEMASFRAFRSFRSFIFKETDQLVTSTEAQSLLPTTILHHLFSRSPDTLQLPHALQGWSLMQYSEWMDHHTETETMMLIKNSLDEYAKLVNSKGEKQYTQVYPIMIQFIADHLNKNKG